MSADVASLVVCVNGEVETHQFGKGWAIVTKHIREIGRPIFVRINAANLCNGHGITESGCGYTWNK